MSHDQGEGSIFWLICHIILIAAAVIVAALILLALAPIEAALRAVARWLGGAS
jgi:hypothetical protein